MPSETSQESTILTARLHWGIFLQVLMLALPLSLLTLSILFFVRFSSNVLSQLTPHRDHSIWGFLYFVTVAPSLLLIAAVLLAVWSSYSRSQITLTTRRLLFRTGIVRKS